MDSLEKRVFAHDGEITDSSDLKFMGIKHKIVRESSSDLKFYIFIGTRMFIMLWHITHEKVVLKSMEHNENYVIGMPFSTLGFWKVI